MKVRQRRVRMLQSIRVPLPITGGEVKFYIGQVALVDPRLANLWIRRGIAEAITSLDDLRGIREQRGVGYLDFARSWQARPWRGRIRAAAGFTPGV